MLRVRPDDERANGGTLDNGTRARVFSDDDEEESLGTTNNGSITLCVLEKTSSSTGEVIKSDAVVELDELNLRKTVG